MDSFGMRYSPKIKFLHLSWSTFQPDISRSFSARILGKLILPPNMEKTIYWSERVVPLPLVNKKICETRANISGAIRQGYLSEYK